MKAKNNREVTRCYLIFAWALSMAVLTGAGLFFCFIRTAQVEIDGIDAKSREYDVAYARQIALTEKVDSLFMMLSLLNSDGQVNEILLQNAVSTKKMKLISAMKPVNERDVLLYSRVSEKVNTVLQIKDSIRILRNRETLIRDELLRCMQDNRKARNLPKRK
ncbi:MAG: type VI secretion system transmembrane protein TssQ [Tannerella sp.]|nr:type VI secretion system transmembrane protein TssQ [Tannerella sp.]